MTKPKIYAFTQETKGIADALYSKIEVIDSSKTDVSVPLGQQKVPSFKCVGLWDV